MAGVSAAHPAIRRALALSGGAVVIGALVVTVGARPFLHGLASVSLPVVGAAVALTAVATATGAWRWTIVARALGTDLSWMSAVASSYRSQFLNVVIPGGVVGDIERAYRHGRRSGSVALAARERAAGQLVQGLLLAGVLVAVGLTSQLATTVWVLAAIPLVVLALGAALATTATGRRMLHRESAHLRRVFRKPIRSIRIVAASVIVVACHTTLFVLAAQATGASAGSRELFVAALIALAASAVPTNIGGWGPREGAAAAVFAALGLGADAGVAASTAFGVVSAIALLPGGLVMIADRISSAREHRSARTAVVASTDRLPERISA